VAASSSLASAAAILKNGGECSMIGIIRDGNLSAAEILREVWQRRLIFRSGWEMLNPIKKQLDDQRVSTEENLMRAMNWMKTGGYLLEPLLTGIIPAEITAIKKAYNRLKDQPDDNMCFIIKWK
jgi:threonine dehydrogenase-like Zn-dependent dehydrogenase